MKICKEIGAISEILFVPLHPQIKEQIVESVKKIVESIIKQIVGSIKRRAVLL